MDVNTLTVAFVIVTLGIAGVIVYLKGKKSRCAFPVVVEHCPWPPATDSR